MKGIKILGKIDLDGIKKPIKIIKLEHINDAVWGVYEQASNFLKSYCKDKKKALQSHILSF